jgi:nucleoside-diphosphate-sugar epimerase
MKRREGPAETRRDDGGIGWYANEGPCGRTARVSGEEDAVNALVIGGTGPTGPLVVEGLAKRGYDVTILHSGRHETEFPFPVEHIHGNAQFPEPFKASLGSRTFDIIIGMYGRLRHIAEIIKGKTDRFIAAGGMPYAAFVEGDKSCAVPVLIREDAPLFRDHQASRFTYLMTASEEAVMDAHRTGHYNATILRFPMIYGPRQVAPREWCIIRRILDGRKRIIIPDGGLKLERRGFVDNVANAVLLAVDKREESAGQVYNVGDETVWSVREWIELIARHLNHQWELVNMPFALAGPTRSYAGRGFHWFPDIGKIRRELGYKDVISPDLGMKQTIEWYLDERPEPGGETEKALGDAFDYASEDRLIDAFAEWIGTTRAASPSGYRFHHAYEHPKDEEETR